MYATSAAARPESDKVTEHPSSQQLVYSTILPAGILGQASQAAGTDITVLMLGESGAGKGILARYIHSQSPRHHRNFVRINVPAIPDTLLESELFGYEKGAFSGADRKRAGKIKYAAGGTVFMDEMGDIPPHMQIKLLNVMEDKEVTSLGRDEPEAVDVRFLVATNRNLEADVLAGRFRLDLFYRINVFPITVPPLRERQQDIEGLAQYFYNQNAQRYYHQDAELHLEPNALNRMLEYGWPGNVRELEGLMARMVIKFQGRSVGLRLNTLDDLLRSQKPVAMQVAQAEQPPIAEAAPYPATAHAPNGDATTLQVTVPAGVYTGEVLFFDTVKQANMQIRRHIIERALAANRWNRKKTAQIIGVSDKFLQSMIKEAGLGKNS